MSGDSWIVVPNWDKFQTYRRRKPPWLKLYTKLRNKPEWERLSLSERGLLVTIWIEYAFREGRLKVSDLADVGPKYAQSRHKVRALESLNHAGFIDIVATRSVSLEKREEAFAFDFEGLSREEAFSLESKTSVENFNPDNSDYLVEKLLNDLDDLQPHTRNVIYGFRHQLPDAAFIEALEALRYRRALGLEGSDAAYVVATLKAMTAEHR